MFTKFFISVIKISNLINFMVFGNKCKMNNPGSFFKKVFVLVW